MIRLELTTTRPPDVYANQLRYIPILVCAFLNAAAKLDIFFQFCIIFANFFNYFLCFLEIYEL